MDAIRGIALVGMVVFHIISLMVIFHMCLTVEWYYEFAATFPLV
ncbi:MAG: hypothetical protein LBU24_01785 [Methanocalculaceae archaeon]|nr:hypothetical protein [Methanocalculaceae archaeon]